jgi:hypothetical protein
LPLPVATGAVFRRELLIKSKSGSTSGLEPGLLSTNLPERAGYAKAVSGR